MLCLLLTVAITGSEVGWVPSVQVAKAYAEKTGKPLIVALIKGNNAAANLTSCLKDPDSAAVASKFVCVTVSTESQLRALANIGTYYDRSMTIFTEPDGTVLCRVGGFLLQPDFVEAAEKALWARNQGRALRFAGKQTASETAQLGLIHAMRGDLNSAKKLLVTAEKAGAARSLLADGYLTLGDQYRAEWKFQESLSPLAKSLALSETPRQKFRTRFRLGLSLFRLRDYTKSKSMLAACVAMPDIAKREKDAADRFLGRVQLMIGSVGQGTVVRR